MPNPFGNPLISEVRGLAEIPPSCSVILDLPGPSLSWAQASDFVIAADRDLDLKGELIQFAQTHKISFQKMEPLLKTTRDSTLSGMSKSGLWQAYSNTSQSDIRYTIFIDYYDHSATILANEEMKAQVMQFFQQEWTRSLLTEASPDESDNPLDTIMKIGNKIMFEFGIPGRKMGFFYNHIKEMSEFEKI